MGKTGKWLKIFLVGPKKNEKSSEKEKTKNRGDLLSVPSATGNPTTPAAVTASTPKEKRRWSFRRSSVTSPATPLKGSTSAEESNGGGGGNAMLSASIEFESEQKKHALAVAAAADAAAVAAEAAAAVIRLTAATRSRINPLEEEAGVKIQSAFRSYLARKALGALRGLVKLQALVRGHLVRKQAMATLRCMHALVTVQDRARVQRLRMVEDSKSLNPRPSTPRKSTQYDRFRHIINHVMEENIKIVEMDIGHSKATGTGGTQQVSQAPSALTELSPRTCSGHFEDYNYCFGVARRSPQSYSVQPRLEATRIPFSTYSRSNYAESESYDYPSYMANTESSRAKARSQSAPKQRAPESFERQPSSRRRPSVEGRNLNNNNNIPRTVRMQRSSSHVGSAVHNYQYPWSVNLDKSSMSLKDSECGSTSTVLTNNNYCRSLVSYSMNGSRNMSLPFPFPPHPHPHPHLPPRHAV